MADKYLIEAVYKSGRKEPHVKPTMKEAIAFGNQLKAIGATITIKTVRGR